MSGKEKWQKKKTLKHIKREGTDLSFSISLSLYLWQTKMGKLRECVIISPLRARHTSARDKHSCRCYKILFMFFLFSLTSLTLPSFPSPPSPPPLVSPSARLCFGDLFSLFQGYLLYFFPCAYLSTSSSLPLSSFIYLSTHKLIDLLLSPVISSLFYRWPLNTTPGEATKLISHLSYGPTFNLQYYLYLYFFSFSNYQCSSS